MSKKDYVKLADLLCRHKESFKEGDLFESFVNDMADILIKDNPRFSYTRFADYIYANRK